MLLRRSIPAVNWNPMLIQANFIEIWLFYWHKALLDNRSDEYNF